MSNIIAGHFQEQDQVKDAVAQLLRTGFLEHEISSFYVSPQGEHDLPLIEVDRKHIDAPNEKEANEGAVRGAATGGAIGVAVGVAGMPIVGPVGTAVGALVGAHVGSLVGVLSQAKEKDKQDIGRELPGSARKPGMMVAVSVIEIDREHDVITLLRKSGADQIERANGTIVNGDWQDFDTQTTPYWIT